MPWFKNTSSVIAAGATVTLGTFQGLGSVVDNVVGIFRADQAGNLTIEHSVDNSNWDYIDTIPVTANVGVKVNVPVVAPYTRVRFNNTAGSDTTFARGSFRTASAGPR